MLNNYVSSRTHFQNKTLGAMTYGCFVMYIHDGSKVTHKKDNGFFGCVHGVDVTNIN
jgi:hypothetical protein